MSLHFTQAKTLPSGTQEITIEMMLGGTDDHVAAPGGFLAAAE